MARVHVAPVGDAAGGGFQIGRGMDDRRILAAQFQHAWGQVLRGGFVDDLADAGAAGEENQIPLLREKGGRLWHRALDDRRSARIEILWNQPGRRCRTRRRDLRRLQHRRISRSERGDERRKQQHERFVPGADDQGDPQRVATNADVAGLKNQRRVDPFIRSPGIQMLQRVIGLLDVVVHVHQIGVHDVATQVLPQRVAEFVMILQEQLPDGLELRLAPGQRTRRPGIEELTLLRDDRGIIGGAHVRSSPSALDRFCGGEFGENREQGKDRRRGLRDRYKPRSAQNSRSPRGRYPACLSPRTIAKYHSRWRPSPNDHEIRAAGSR